MPAVFLSHGAVVASATIRRTDLSLESENANPIIADKLDVAGAAGVATVTVTYTQTTYTVTSTIVTTVPGRTTTELGKYRGHQLRTRQLKKP